MDRLTGNFVHNAYDYEGLVFTAYILFAFGLAVLAGQLLRRSIPAMLSALVPGWPSGSSSSSCSGRASWRRWLLQASGGRGLWRLRATQRPVAGRRAGPRPSPASGGRLAAWPAGA